MVGRGSQLGSAPIVLTILCGIIFVHLTLHHTLSAILSLHTNLVYILCAHHNLLHHFHQNPPLCVCTQSQTKSQKLNILLIYHVCFHNSCHGEEKRRIKLQTSLLLSWVCNARAWLKVTHWKWLARPQRPLQATSRGNYASHRHYRQLRHNRPHYPHQLYPPLLTWHKTQLWATPA